MANSGGYSGDGGAATAAQLNSPEGLAVDKTGNIYIADYSNSLIRRVDAVTGIITTIAGVPGNSGYNGDNIAATTAQLKYPAGVAVDTSGNVFIVDSSNDRIRRVDAVTGMITTVAGNGNYGYSGDGGLATAAMLAEPYGMAVDPAGNLYIADTGNSYVRRVDALTGIITTLAGTGSNTSSGDNGPATSASVNQPCGLAIDAAGNLYIADTYSNLVRMIAAATNATLGTTAGYIYTVAGTGAGTYSGDGGLATSAALDKPEALAFDKSGNLYIADQDNYVVRVVAAGTQIISTLAGTGVYGSTGDGGLASLAELGEPAGVAFDGNGNLYVVDYAQYVVRKVTATTGNIPFPTVAVGSSSAAVTLPLVIDGTTSMTWTSLTSPASQGGLHEYTVAGNSCAMNAALAAGTICNVTLTFSPGYPGLRGLPLVLTTSTGTYRYGLSGVGLGPQIAVSPALITTAAGFYPGNYAFAGDGGPATSAEFDGITGIAFDPEGNLYIDDRYNYVIREVNALTGNISTIAGTAGTSGSGGNGGPATSATFYRSSGVAVDSAGNVYIADFGNNIIRKIDATTGIINLFAGTIGSQGYSGDGGPATSALLYHPVDLSFDAAGNLYFTDTGNEVVRRIDAGTGQITTIAGLGGSYGYNGTNIAATTALLNFPQAVKIDPSGDISIDDTDNEIVRVVNATTGLISTVAGDQSQGFGGDGGPATSATLSSSAGLAFDPAGDLYIADSANNELRVVNVNSGIISSFAGNSTEGYTGDGGSASSAEMGFPVTPVFDSQGNLYYIDGDNNVVRKVGGVAPLTFAATYLGAAAVAQDVTITNNGNAALTLSALTLPADFNLTGADTTCTAATSLAPATSCVLGVIFQPATAGAKSETVTVVDNQGTQTIPVSGTGLALTATTTTLQASSMTSVYGQSLTLTATIFPVPTGSPVGTVSFYSGSTLLGAGTPDGSGIATLATTDLLNGTDAVTAVYSGNAGFIGSTSAAVSIVVTLPLADTGGAFPAAHFAATAIGSTSAPITLTFTVTTNATSISAVTVPVSQGGVQEYTVTADSCALNTPLASGTVCNLAIAFSPGYPGRRNVPLVVTTSAGTFNFGLDGIGNGPQTVLGPGIITTVASTVGILNYPNGLIADAAGNLYFADSNHQVVRKIAAIGGAITVVAGNGTSGYSGDGGLATSAEMDEPAQVGLDASGNLYIVDYGNSAIRRVDAGSGIITTIAGGNGFASSGDGGPATAAQLLEPTDVKVDSLGNVFICDYGGNVIRKVDTTGIITTVAGTGTGGYNGDGPATTARLDIPYSVVVDSAGNLYIADYGNFMIRRVDAGTGMLTTVAGIYNGNGYSGDGGPAVAAQVGTPQGIAVDSADNLYIADSDNSVVRFVSAASGIITTLAGNGNAGYTGDGGPATQAKLAYVTTAALDSTGNLYLMDDGNNVVRVVKGAPAFNFDTTAVGSTSSDSPETVTLTNIGNTALTFAVPGTGSNPSVAAGFTLGNGGTCPQLTPGTYAATLAVGGTCTLQFNFIPVSVGSIVGSATVSDNSLDASAMQTVALTGMATIGFEYITFSAPPSQVVGTPLTLMATVNSGLPITYTSSTPAVCTISGDVATFLTTGTCTINADQPGDANYTPAGTVTVTFAVIPVVAVGSTSAVQTATLTVMNADVIKRTRVLTQGALNLDFNLVAGGTCVIGNSYNVGDTCTVLYTFTPAHPGQRLGGVTLVGVSTAVMGSTLMSGVGTGPQTIFSSNHLESTLATGFGYPEGIAVSAAGDVFVADETTVKQVLAAGGYTTVNTIGTGLNVSGGVAVDGNGNVYVANGYALTELVAQGGYSTTVSIPGQFGQLNGVAVDGMGDLFIADSNNSIIQNLGVPGTNTTYLTLGTGFSEPESLAVDGSGNVFVADTGNNAVKEILAADNYTTVVTLASAYTQAGGFNSPEAVAIDAAGNVFVADNDNNAIKEILAAGGYTTVLTLASDFVNPYGVAVDGSGNVFVADSGNAALKKLDFVTPPSLSFATSAVGTTSSDSPQIVSVANDGNLDLAISGLAVGTTDFSLTGSTCVTTAPLAAGSACNLDLSFTPQTVGSPLTDSATLTDNTLNIAETAQVVSLLGTATIGAQTISFANPGPQPIDSTLTLAATVNSGLPVSYTSSTPNVCTVSGNSATLLALGTCTITATRAGTANYAAATPVSVSFSVVPDAPVITITVSPLMPGYGQAVTVTVALSAAGVPVSGSVASVTVDGHTYTCTTTSLGQCMVTIPGGVLSLGSNSLAIATAATATVSAGSGSASITVVAEATTTTLAVSTANPVFGQPVTLTATVSPIPTGSPLGTVSFYSGTTLLGTGTVNSAGVATLTTSALPAGTDSVTAVYSGTTSGYASSTSVAHSLAVSTEATTITLAASSTTPAFGQSVTLTATVSPVPTGSPLGTVSFYSGTTLLGTGTVNSSGVATLTTSALPVGTDSVTAVYSGNTSFAGSTSAASTFTVLAPAVVVTASLAPASPVYGQTASLLVSDSANGVPVVGSLVTASVGGHTFTCTTNSAGQCSIALTAGAVPGGADTIAVAAGATSLAPAGSTSLAVVVQPATAAVNVSVGPTSPVYGEPVSLSVAESVGILPIAGSTATVVVDGHTYTCITSAQGACTIALPGGVLVGGTNAIVVTTSATADAVTGSANHSVSVATASTAVTATISPLQPGYGHAATITISATTDTPNLPALPVVGAVETVTVAGKSYSCTTGITGQCQILLPAGALPGGTDQLALASAATANTAASTGSLSVTVGPAPTTLTLGSSSTQVTAGDPITLTATVAALVAGTPTGTVTFFANSSAIGTGTVISGVASLTLSTLAVGANAISASYSGDASFLPSTASGFTQTVLVNFTIVITGGTSGSTPTQTVQPGGTAVYPLSLGIINGFVGPITMSASGLPTGAIASFNPDIVNLDGIHPGTTVLSIATGDIVGRATEPNGTHTGQGVAYGLVLLPLLYLRRMRRRLKRLSRPLLGRMLAAIMLAGAVALSGCGAGGYFGSGPKSYVVTVTATSGELHHSTTVTLTVQ